jgi:hypothetical protein
MCSRLWRRSPKPPAEASAFWAEEESGAPRGKGGVLSVMTGILES